jgi:hypothetical protein
MKELRKQHRAAIALLKTLGLTYIRLEPDKEGKFRFLAWSTPLIDGNGSPRPRKEGVIKV